MNEDHPESVVCPHAGYIVRQYPLVMACRCLICARCGQHTGNSTQGHFWRLCRASGDRREAHFCCPGDCELETR